MTMSNRIGRTITRCICTCIVVEPDNSIVKKDVTIYGDYKAEKWLKNAVKRKLNNDNVLIESVKKISCYYSMTIENFVKHAEKQEEKEVQNG